MDKSGSGNPVEDGGGSVENGSRRGWDADGTFGAR